MTLLIREHVDASQPRHTVLVECIGTRQLLCNSFDLILRTIPASLDAPALFMRMKALQALGQIIVIDNQVLHDVSIHPVVGYYVETVTRLPN